MFTYLNDLPCLDNDMKNMMRACTYGTVILLFVSIFAPQIPSIVSTSAQQQQLIYLRPPYQILLLEWKEECVWVRAPYIL